MQLHELDLTVGDVLQIGERTLTVLDIENGEVTFRIDDSEVREEPDKTSPIPRPR